jgi:hypothetical protein
VRISIIDLTVARPGRARRAPVGPTRDGGLRG